MKTKEERAREFANSEIGEELKTSDRSLLVGYDRLWEVAHDDYLNGWNSCESIKDKELSTLQEHLQAEKERYIHDMKYVDGEYADCLAELEDQLRWRSVEEAPKNDNRVLIRLNTCEIGFARFKKGNFIIESESFGKRVIEWLPIPRKEEQ